MGLCISSGDTLSCTDTLALVQRACQQQRTVLEPPFIYLFVTNILHGTHLDCVNASVDIYQSERNQDKILEVANLNSVNNSRLIEYISLDEA